MARREELSDEQWAILEPLFPSPRNRPDGRERPRRATREVLNGILWVLRSGARWQDMPDRFPPYQTCHRRFQEWTRSCLIRQALESLARDLLERGGFDLSECYIDATFMIAKKGASGSEEPTGGRVRRSWRWHTALVFLSPFTLRVLRRTNSPLFMIISKNGFSDHRPVAQKRRPSGRLFRFKRSSNSISLQFLF